MTYKERLELFKSRVTTKPYTFADEEEREGITYEIRDVDYEWLLKALEGKDKVITSFARTIEGMEADRDYWKEKYLLLQRQ